MHGACIMDPGQVHRLHTQAKLHKVDIGEITVFIRGEQRGAAVEALSKVAGESAFRTASIGPRNIYTSNGAEETAAYTAFVRSCSILDDAMMSRSTLELRGSSPWSPLEFLTDNGGDLRRWGHLELYWYWDQLLGDATLEMADRSGDDFHGEAGEHLSSSVIAIYLRVEQAIDENFDNQLQQIEQNAEEWIPRLASVLYRVFGPNATCSVSVVCEDFLFLMRVGDTGPRCAAATRALQRRLDIAWAGLLETSDGRGEVPFETTERL